MDLRNLQLGGLMGASPYSNLSILEHRRPGPQDQRHLQMLRTPNNYLNSGQGQQGGPFHTSTPVIKFVIPDRIVQDVMCRFVVNIPDEEKFDPVRALFQIELAHWFFIDHYCGSGGDSEVSSLVNIPFSQFAYIMFQKTPHLRKFYPEVDRYLSEFRAYRSRVPTFGALLMNQELTKVVLVQGFRNQWGFPKGKVNEVEDPVECAIREVFEETGYDMRPLINQGHYIESKTRERNDRLYLVRGVDSKFPFYPQTQYEIKSIAWFNIDELPEHKKDTNPGVLKLAQPITNFFTIYPYIKRLKVWINDKLEGRNKIECFRSRWFDSDKEEAENIFQYPFQKNVTPGPGMGYENTMNYLFTGGGGGGTPGQEILSSMQKGLPNVQNSRPNVLVGSQNKPESSKKPAGKGSKSKKRLFQDGVENSKVPQSPKQQSKKEVSVMSLEDMLKSASINKNQGGIVGGEFTIKLKNRKFILDEKYCAPSWLNFKFDKNRVERAYRGELLRGLID